MPGILHPFKPTAAAVIACVALAGCEAPFTASMTDGVPLAELDRSGKAPAALMLAAPDRVIVSEGDALDIAVSGSREATERLRFSLEDGELSIMREGDWRDRGVATVRVIMPRLQEITLAGSGMLEAAALGGEEAEATVAGSGRLTVAKVSARSLEVNIMGSGQIEAAGRADQLELNVAGSGSSRMRGLKVDRAEVTVAGSGDGEFSSDGSVEADVAGSGTVIIHGKARCMVSAMGSGDVICRHRPAE